MVVPLSIAEQHELAWREAKAHRAPEAEALELRWRETLLGVDSALDFIPLTSPRLSRPSHLRRIAQFFIDAESEPTFLASSVPPQHGKTILISHLLVRYMKRFPEKRNAYVSYAIDRAHRVGRPMLEIARRAGLRLKVANQGEWVTPEGGSLIITGIGGNITGDPIDGILVGDDLHKDRAEANSATIRQTATEYITVTASGRLHPCASMLLNGTRWHLLDAIGEIQEREARDPIGWKFINLPAINDRGEPLWPEERPLNFLQRQRRILGHYDFCAEYLGQPIPEGGELFHAPAYYDAPDVDTTGGVRILVACDPAVTAKSTADFSAIVVGAMRPHPEGFHSLDILDFRSLQCETPQLVRELIDLQLKYQSTVAVETAGAFKAVPQMMRQIDPRLRVFELPPRGDKLVRARPVAAAWNDGRVRIPKAAPWVDRFLKEVRSFTGIGDVHDDAVDALAHCWDGLVMLSTVRRTPIESFERLARLG